MAKFSNVHITHTSDAMIALGWTDAEGNRYHVWLDPETLQPRSAFGGGPKVILYKNPPMEVKYRGEGYFKTRQLDATAAKNAEMLRKVMASIDIRAALDVEIAKKQADALEKANLRRMDYIIDRKRAAGEQLYDACKDALSLLNEISAREPKADAVIAKLNMAIKQADADAHTLDIKDFM